MRCHDNWGKDIIEQLPQGNYLIASLDRYYPYDEIKKYDFIVSATTGTDHIEHRDIPILSLKSEPEFLKDIPATAEHTIGLMLALMRKIPQAHNDVMMGSWDRERWQGQELKGKRLGITGYGRVGKQVKTIAQVFGMEVFALDKETINVFNVIDGEEYTMFDYVHVHNNYEDILNNFILKHSDIITVHVPLTDETRDMFTLDHFKLMKPSTYFINTSRGQVIEEGALPKAIHQGLIAGCAVDVLRSDNMGADYVMLRSLAQRGHNVIMTPHIGGCTVESRRKCQEFMLSKIKEYVRSD